MNAFCSQLIVFCAWMVLPDYRFNNTAWVNEDDSVHYVEDTISTRLDSFFADSQDYIIIADFNIPLLMTHP